MSGSISWTNNNFTGVYCSVLWYEYCTSYSIDARISFHRSTASNVTLSRHLVLSMILTPWWILSKIAFACIFFIVVHVNLTEKSLSNEMKILLSSEPLLKIILCILGYIDSHTSLNIWDILAEYWSMIRTSAISNHPVDGLIKFMHSNWSSFVGISLAGCVTLASIVYIPIGSTYTVCHGVRVPSSLAGRSPYLALHSLNFLQYLDILHIFPD